MRSFRIGAAAALAVAGGVAVAIDSTAGADPAYGASVASCWSFLVDNPSEWSYLDNANVANDDQLYSTWDLNTVAAARGVGDPLGDCARFLVGRVGAMDAVLGGPTDGLVSLPDMESYWWGGGS